MTKLVKVCLYILMSVVVITVLHIWQNVGFDHLAPKWLSHDEEEEAKFKVGFLPVT